MKRRAFETSIMAAGVAASVGCCPRVFVKSLDDFEIIE
jgi:hypothetical protein